jgi:hypothetical protein
MNILLYSTWLLNKNTILSSRARDWANTEFDFFSSSFTSSLLKFASLLPMKAVLRAQTRFSLKA